MGVRSRGLAWLLMVSLVSSVACTRAETEEQEDTDGAGSSTEGIGASAEEPSDPTFATELGVDGSTDMTTEMADSESTGPASTDPCELLGLVGLPKVEPGTDAVHAVDGYFRARKTAASGEYEIFDPSDGEYPDQRVKMSWRFSGIPNVLTRGETFDVTASGVCTVEPDHSWGPGEASYPILWSNVLKIDNSAVKGLCTGRSNATTGKGELTSTSFWRVEVPPGLTAATIAIGDGGRLGTIATYEYACRTAR
jgi:hypothetical protein